MVKRILRWFLFGGILFFLAKTLKDHWQEVRSLELTNATLPLLTIALGITLIAHIWSGWVWHLILKTIGQPRDGRWSTVVYLKTNIAKYLPGNVWHFYGRVRALQSSGSSTGAAIVGVLLEPLLMAAAALGLAAISFSLTVGSSDWRLLALSLGALVAMLVAIHPRFLNPLLRKLGKAKAQAQGLTVITSTLRLQTYPWRSLLGELGFVALRGMGFVMTIVALQALKPSQFLPVMGAFSIAWLFGLVVPGAPGGVGVFEAVAIALLGNQLPSGLLISSVALYRLISTLAEALGAGLIWIEDRIADFMVPVAKAKKRILLLPPAKDDIIEDPDQEPTSSEDIATRNNLELSESDSTSEEMSEQVSTETAIQPDDVTPEITEPTSPVNEEPTTAEPPTKNIPPKTSDIAPLIQPPVSESIRQTQPGKPSEPVLPPFTPQPIKVEEEPTSQSLSPKQ
ncbi:lysylphosphatidylglycerol synthase transmembrane domain-containing protein [Leptothoe spongobia]|uniref:Flippase-like domain-containing protein n=1 Tax=Leptothoe spongobia TAU-MAC 1115 TaxID=1967444 RepID=A0A947GHJ6_9CYAN|nr:YbhN family protein [Leptothoe spongobia]MBT9315024.1 flippase-like domain-containing protein [Leptothoe spongobia TAU-MAC 1115]